MSDYTIDAAIFILPIPLCKRFTHNFWLLRDIKNNKVIAQLHGFATSRRTNKIVPIGYKREHSLRAYCLIYDNDFANQYNLELNSYKLPIHAYKTIYTGNDSIPRWLQAVHAIKAINSLNLDYPRGGFCLPLARTINSNSVYHTFAQVMGIPLPIFADFLQVGIHTSLYELIKHHLK
ncbi:hypothetical protein ACNVED_01150 [Legionella sp. D16C41]|uniref:hypothetical protein n=1 Tax=Legionella sp. D16C41 TaxID=3402688 RepID=UPI003AF713C1